MYKLQYMQVVLRPEDIIMYFLQSLRRIKYLFWYWGRLEKPLQAFSYVVKTEPLSQGWKKKPTTTRLTHDSQQKKNNYNADKKQAKGPYLAAMPE